MELGDVPTTELFHPLNLDTHSKSMDRPATLPLNYETTIELSKQMSLALTWQRANSGRESSGRGPQMAGSCIMDAVKQKYTLIKAGKCAGFFKIFFTHSIVNTFFFTIPNMFLIGL